MSDAILTKNLTDTILADILAARVAIERGRTDDADAILKRVELLVAVENGIARNTLETFETSMSEAAARSYDNSHLDAAELDALMTPSCRFAVTVYEQVAA
jgi:hypothetical protein